MKILNLIFLFSLFLFAKEPSAFEAGNLDSPNPYGLTTSEKYILQNKKAIKKLKNENLLLSEKIENLKEELEGLKSVTEGINRNLNSIKLKVDNIDKNKIASLKENLSQIRDDLNRTISIQNENYNQIKNVLKELTSLIDNINNSYISKDEFNKEIKNLYSYINGKLKKGSLASKSGRYLYTKAKEYYRKKDYTKSKEYFLWSIKKHYRPATSSFYIGEICYYKKDYSCAIKYYKKSASLYSKSSFMPTLMLHSAISLEKLNQKREAKLFYENLIKRFPKSKAAKIAKANLKKLKF